LTQTETISLYHPLLQSIALKMVGSLADAEDIVQDTFFKWLTVDQAKIKNPKSYLVRAVTNNCLNHLEALKRKKNEYLETLHPEDFIGRYREADFLKFDIENEISAALNVMHRKLEPMEKAIYILREVFNYEYEDLQDIFDKKKDNCRQLFCRAKEKLNQESKRFKIDFPKQTQFLENFKKACVLGHSSELINHLRQEVSAKFKR